MYFEHAIGSSHDPGTDCTTIFDSFTPEARSFAFVPARRGSMIAVRLSIWSAPNSCLQALRHGGVKRTGVPACVHDADAETAAVVLLGFSGAFE